MQSSEPPLSLLAAYDRFCVAMSVPSGDIYVPVGPSVVVWPELLAEFTRFGDIDAISGTDFRRLSGGYNIHVGDDARTIVRAKKIYAFLASCGISAALTNGEHFHTQDGDPLHQLSRAIEASDWLYDTATADKEKDYLPCDLRKLAKLASVGLVVSGSVKIDDVAPVEAVKHLYRQIRDAYTKVNKAATELQEKDISSVAMTDAEAESLLHLNFSTAPSKTRKNEWEKRRPDHALRLRESGIQLRELYIKPYNYGSLIEEVETEIEWCYPGMTMNWVQGRTNLALRTVVERALLKLGDKYTVTVRGALMAGPANSHIRRLTPDEHVQFACGTTDRTVSQLVDITISRIGNDTYVKVSPPSNQIQLLDTVDRVLWLEGCKGWGSAIEETDDAMIQVIETHGSEPRRIGRDRWSIKCPHETWEERSSYLTHLVNDINSASPSVVEIDAYLWRPYDSETPKTSKRYYVTALDYGNGEGELRVIDYYAGLNVLHRCHTLATLSTCLAMCDVGEVLQSIPKTPRCVTVEDATEFSQSARRWVAGIYETMGENLEGLITEKYQSSSASTLLVGAMYATITARLWSITSDSETGADSRFASLAPGPWLRNQFYEAGKQRHTAEALRALKPQKLNSLVVHGSAAYRLHMYQSDYGEDSNVPLDILVSDGENTAHQNLRDIDLVDFDLDDNETNMYSLFVQEADNQLFRSGLMHLMHLDDAEGYSSREIKTDQELHHYWQRMRHFTKVIVDGTHVLDLARATTAAFIQKNKNVYLRKGLGQEELVAAAGYPMPHPDSVEGAGAYVLKKVLVDNNVFDMRFVTKQTLLDILEFNATIMADGNEVLQRKKEKWAEQRNRLANTQTNSSVGE